MTAKSWDEQIAALREGAVIDTRHGDDRVRKFCALSKLDQYDF